jgi:glycosyltransferase involved in cell wall biosynthesis
MGNTAKTNNVGNANKTASSNIANVKKANNNTSNNNSNKTAEAEGEGGSTMWLIVKVVIMIIVLVAIFYIAKYLLVRYQTASANTPYLLNGSKNAKHALVISQDSTSVNYIPIKQSEDQDGIQFTYGFWFVIEDFTYKKGEWKHIFHKGNSSSYPNRAPGVWIHPDKNAIRVYMNTLDNILEYADIDNIPMSKWIYMNVIVNNKNLDLYINGFLKIRKELSSLPKQNNDDFWVNMFGGFEGYISNIRYYSYVIDFNEINSMIKAGPSLNNCIATGELPPYLDDNWWFGYDV